MEIKTFEQIYQDMRNYMIAHQDRLTDFNAGGTLTSQLESFARELALLYIECRVGFASYLRSLPYSVFGFTMKSGYKAGGKVTFSRSKPLAFGTTIPAGTKVASGAYHFFTAEAGVIEGGAKDSSPIPVVAEKIGEPYNVRAGTIKTIVSTLNADVVAVNNTDPASGGQNAEDWASYADRFADYIIGLQRTNSAGLITALTSGDEIRSLGIEEHFPPLNGLWNMTLYLEDGSGGITPEALAQAEKIIDGDFDKGISGFRPPGVNIRYLPPSIVPITITAAIRIRHDDQEIDEGLIVTTVKETVQRHIDRLKVGQAVCLSEVMIALKRLPHLLDVHIVAPEDDVVISQSQIARYQACEARVLES